MSPVIPHPARLAVLLLALAAPAAHGAAGPVGPPTAYQVPITLPDGVADPAGKRGYFRAAQDTVEAIDLATGLVIWKTAAPAFPLAVWRGEAVVAVRVKDQRDRLQIAVLDGDGVSSLQSQEIQVAGYRKGYDGYWTARPYLDGDELLLRWSVYWSRKDGREEDSSYRTGVVRVNLKTGKVMAVNPKHRSLRPPLRLGDRMANELKALPRDRRYFPHTCWGDQPQPLFDGDRLGVVWLEADGKDEMLTLRTWDAHTGKDVRTRKLLRREHGCHMGSSSDERYLFFQHQRKDDPHRPDRYCWQIYRLATGQHVGRFPLHSYTISSGTVGVVGGRVFVTEQLSAAGDRGVAIILHAREQKTGKLLWKRAVPVVSSAFPLQPH